MKAFLAIVSLLALVLVMPAFAAKKGTAPSTTPAPTPAMRVVQVDPASITVNVGESGDEHFTYRITDNTKVTLNGAPVAARDLRAGMVVHLSVSPDRATVLAINAKDALAAKPSPHPGKHRGG